MDINQKSPMYDIDRKTAGRLLKVSVRTIDRYINGNKISHERRDGRIWLDKKEIMQLKSSKRVDRSVGMSTPKMSMDKVDLIPVDMSIDSEGNTYHVAEQEESFNDDPSVINLKNAQIKATARSSEEDTQIYKNLYEKLQEELKEKEQRLEMANYRIGQLESHIKETVPLLDYKRDLANEQAEKAQLRKDLDNHVMELSMAMNNFREEKMNKKIYLILLFILLLLQPLWFLLPPK